MHIHNTYIELFYLLLQVDMSSQQDDMSSQAYLLLQQVRRASDHWVASSNPLRASFVINFASLSPVSAWPSLA